VPSPAIVDPRFPHRLRELRQQRGVSLRDLAKKVFFGKSYLHELETGDASPRVEVAERLDEVLGAGGELARMVYEVDGGLATDEDERLVYATAHPRRTDASVIDSLATMLSHQRRLEDSIGSALLVGPVLAQLVATERLVEDAPDNDQRRRLVDVAAQWAHFAGWLCTTTGDHVAGRAWYLRAMEWASEAGNADMIATTLSMRGHLAWTRGQIRAMVELSRAATWQPASIGVRALAVQQEGRGLAILGDGPNSDDRLDEAEEMAAKAASRPDSQPDWLYFYDPAYFALQRGLAQLYLGRYERAVELFLRGLKQVPADIRESDWIGWYVLQLAAAYQGAGDMDTAAEATEQARRIAVAASAARLGSEVEQQARVLGL
jgi:transcriptional regulator with XRE-family HTH domain